MTISKIINIISLIGLVGLSGCFSVKVKPVEYDCALLFEHNNKHNKIISILNSATNIKIKNIVYHNDTVAVSYKFCVFCEASPVVPVMDETKYIKCGKKVYEIEQEVLDFRSAKINR